MTEQVPPRQGSEQVPTKIQSVLDRLSTLHDTSKPGGIDIAAKLDDQPQAGDSFAGIVIAPLPDAGSVTALDGQVYNFFAARVYPGKHVNPHFHMKGQEPYKVVSGEGGVMHLGVVNGDTVEWRKQTADDFAAPGNEIIVQEGEVHSFENTGPSPIDFTFSCPKSHLNEEDRVFTMQGFQNGLPHYKN